MGERTSAVPFPVAVVKFYRVMHSAVLIASQPNEERSTTIAIVLQDMEQVADTTRTLLPSYSLYKNNQDMEKAANTS